MPSPPRARPAARPTARPAPSRSRARSRRARPRRGRGIALALCAAALGALLTGTLATVNEVLGISGPLASTAPLFELPAASPTAVAPPAGPPAPPVDLAAAVEAAESAAERDDVVVGVAVADRTTGQLARGHRGDRTFNAASLAKLVLAVDMIDRQERGALTLGDRDRRLLHAALNSSSDEAMNALWSSYDGPGAITRVAEGIGMVDTTSADDPSQWGEVQTSARDMVTLMRHVRDDLPPADRDLLIGDLSSSPEIATDGFDQGYGLLDGSGSPVKQGWLCCLSSRADMHTMGIVEDRFVVAVMTNQPRGFGPARDTVDDAVRAVRNRLGVSRAR